ncbi:hypothetical protein KKF82_08285 [Patescibacteria group bacterium]|nr:hypothetical protein [Patescibacteria group bacterium]
MFGDKRLTGHIEDVPIGIGSSYSKESLSNRLPAGLGVGYELIAFVPEVAKDPVVLRDRWHHIIYQWQDGFVPSWVDVLNVCNRLGLT